MVILQGDTRCLDTLLSRYADKLSADISIRSRRTDEVVLSQDQMDDLVLR